MVKIAVKYVDRVKDRYGKVRLYFRVGKGPRTPLRGPLGSPEFWEDYNKAAGEHLPTARTAVNPGSFRYLVREYYGSSDFKQLRESTRNNRRNILERFCATTFNGSDTPCGDLNYRQLLPRHARKIRDNMQDTPAAANNLMKCLSGLYRFAVERDLADTNPINQVSKLKSGSGGYHSWSLDEIEKYEATHPVGTKARLALALFLYTGQRKSDVLRMGPQHIQHGWMRVVQEKTGARIEIPVMKALQEIIDESETGDMTFLVTKDNQPFSAKGFSKPFRKWCDEAGLPHCSSHGLRKAVAARLAEIGCTTHEIMAITGHKSVSEVERYTQAARQRELAGRARDRLEG
jgi:integrase